MKRVIAVLLSICLMASLPIHALAAPAKTSGTAGTLRLEATEGTVQLKNAAGKNLKATDGARLYNGYALTTKKASYAYISLDDTKAVKLDASSSSEVFQAGKKLELRVSSGQIFFNVSAPLKADESLTIRTSTMVTAVRGTCGWVETIDRHTTRVSLLEGELSVVSTDPLTKNQRTTTIVGGQTATIVYHGEEQGAADETPIEDETIQDLIEEGVIRDEHIILEETGLTVEILQEEDVPGSVAVEVKKDPVLQERIDESTELSVPEIIGDAEERVTEEETKADAEDADIQDTLEELGAEVVDPVFEETVQPGASTGGSSAPQPEQITHNLTIICINDVDGVTLQQFVSEIPKGTEYAADPPEFEAYELYDGRQEGDPETGIMDADKTVIFYYTPKAITLTDPTTIELQEALDAGYSPISIEKANDTNTLDLAEAINGSAAGRLTTMMEIWSGEVNIARDTTVVLDTSLFVGGEDTVLNNNGTLLVNGGVEVSTGGILNNDGVIENSGMFDMSFGGVMNNNGTLTSTGYIMFFGGTGELSRISNTGTFYDYGNTEVAGTITSSGSMTVGGSFSTTGNGQLIVSGTFTVEPEGVVSGGISIDEQGEACSIIVDGGRIVAASEDDYCITCEAPISVTVKNGGVISGGVAGIVLTDNSVVTVEGGEVSGSVDGIVLGDSCTLTVTGGTITGETAIQIMGYTTESTIVTIGEDAMITSTDVENGYAIWNVYNDNMSGPAQISINGIDVSPETVLPAFDNITGRILFDQSYGQ